ncbi:unnamed protein product [Auanema sp. JU1783]|nr:unnamed protein product [Auanema sp. JU1783]
MHSTAVSIIYLTLVFGMTMAHLHPTRGLTTSLSDYRRPICSPDQTCSYEAMGLTFSLCDCPQQDSCHEKHSFKHQNTVYSFCQQYLPPVCWENDISVVVSGIQTSIRCICPEDYTVKKDKSLKNGDVQFRCVSTMV